MSNRKATRKSTLYRLTLPDRGETDLRTYVRDRYLKSDNHSVAAFARGAVDGLVVTGGVRKGRADWCDAVQTITGVDVDVASQAAAGLVITRTPTAVYALTYGVGHHMLESDYKDDGFGLEFATRSLDEDGVIRIRNLIMDGRGRVDESSVSRGDRIDGFGIDRYGAIVKRLSGTVSDIALTSVREGRKSQIRVECADSAIKLPLATQVDDFLSDLRAIEEVCAGQPHPDLLFIDRIRALPASSPKVEKARQVLDELLANPAGERLALGVPEQCLDSVNSAQCFRIKGPGRPRVEVADLELSDLLEYVRGKPAGTRLEALEHVRVTLFSDEDCQTPASSAVKGTHWLLADVPVGSARFFYSHGQWYEVGAIFVETLEDELRQLLGKAPTVSLPPWSKGTKVKNRDSHDEDWYNKQVAKQEGYTLFDKSNPVTKKFRGGGLEICDVLGPEGQLICIKKADSKTSPLNHLFAQASVAVEALRTDPEMRAAFQQQVADRAADEQAPDSGAFHVVLGILLKDGEDITVTSLFAFAQVSLLQHVRRLRAMNAEVEVITIRRQ
ncbi:DUF6119 family protein [Streptomyces sp. NPDC017936]|uniref:DUF6119 family protein n=1 Tax=Streptomyces sp. NPDC017936 TaxID=3365016 RepID=UPI0037B70E54